MKPAVSLKCFYCEREFIPEHYGTNKPLAKTIDHIIPLAKRGNNSPENKVYSCIECNNLKANLTLDEFKQQVEILILKGDLYYKTIPKELFYTIIKNIFALKKYVDEYNPELHLRKGERNKYSFRDTDEFVPPLPVSENIKSLLKNQNPKRKKKRSLVGEHLERIKKSETILSDTNILIKRMEQAYGHDFNVNKSTEKDLFLMHQTETQLQLSKKFGWKVAQMMTEPELNFHY